MKLHTQAEVREACAAIFKTRSVKRRREIRAALDDAEARATKPCCGEAHTNPHIDNCGICAPFWGKVLP